MIRYNITYGATLQAPSVEARHRAVRPARQGPVLPLLVSAALHAAALGLCLVAVSLRPPPAAPDDQAIEMVFEAPPAAAPAPEPPTAPPPPDELPPPPEAPPPEPAPTLTQPAEPLPVPPPPPPRAMPPPRPVAKAPPPPRPEAPATAAPAPVAAPPPVATATPAASAPAVDPRWSRSVSEWLEAHRTYPDEARRRGEEGRVALRFTVDRAGAVLDVELVHSSGSPRLDAAALALLRTAALPPFAASMTAGQITITMQIRYGLMP